MRERHQLKRIGWLAKQIVCFVVICFPLLFTGQLFGAIWDGSVGNWDTDASWLPGGTEPTIIDEAEIDAGTVTVDQVGEAARELEVGRFGTGTLNVETGGTVYVDSESYLGHFPGSTGTATVSGVGSTWTNRSRMTVGWEGSGTLNVEAGGAVSNTEGWIGYERHSTGTVTVSGAGSIWTNSEGLFVGDYGSGTLIVEDGGTVSNDGFSAHLGRETGSTGTVTVTGPGSTWTSSRKIQVGNGGRGTLIVEAGGTVSNDRGYIGSVSGTPATATVTGVSSTWTNSSYLEVGYKAGGSGTLNVEAGGAVSNTEGRIAPDPGSVGMATVIGVGSTWTNSGGLFVGGTSTQAGGSGTLNVLGGGLVNVTGGPMKVWNLSTVTLDGGTLDATSIDLTAGGTFDFLDGTLSVDSFLGTLDQDGGTLSPGSSPGITTVSADYNLNAGSLAIEIGGLTPGTEHDQVSVTGALNLGLTSVLDVLLINAYAPLDGDSFDILDFGWITGNFSAVNLPTLGGGLDWDTSNLLIDGTLSVMSILLDGDLNGDGFVGIEDLNTVLGVWNTNVTPGDLLAGDPSGDGFVGIADLNVVLGKIAFEAYFISRNLLSRSMLHDPLTFAIASIHTRSRAFKSVQTR